MKRQALHTVHLHGSLAKFGTAHRLAVNTPLEAIRALAMQLEGFGDAMRSGMFRLVRGNPDTGMHYEVPYNDRNNSYDVIMLGFSLGPAGEDFHIVPVIAGAGGNGAGKAVLGAVIMVAAVVGAVMVPGFQLAPGLAGPTLSFGAAMGSTAAFGVTWGGVAMFGAALMLGGIGMMLQPSVKNPNYSASENPDQRASFFLGGQVNQSSQGGPVVLAYGRCRIGSTVVSAGLSAERI